MAVNADNAKKALELHAIAHPNDRLVGWYRTGLRVDGPSISIHQTVLIDTLIPQSNKISKKAGPELLPNEYIHLLIDTGLKDNKLSMKAFTVIPINDPLLEMEFQQYLKEKKRREKLAKQKQSNPKSSKKKRKRNRGGNKNGDNDESKTNVTSSNTTATQSEQSSPNKKDNNNKSQQKESKEKEKEKEKANEKEEELEKVDEPYPIFHRFKEIKTEYLASESEKIGLDMIIESPPEGNALDSPSMLMNDTNHLENLLQILLQNLDQIEYYVHGVIDGQYVGDENIGWLIGDALSSVPNLSPAKFESMISNRLQDFLMMVYLGKMTKAQLVMADKINKVLPSTVPGYEGNI